MRPIEADLPRLGRSSLSSLPKLPRAPNICSRSALCLPLFEPGLNTSKPRLQHCTASFKTVSSPMARYSELRHTRYRTRRMLRNTWICSEAGIFTVVLTRYFHEQRVRSVFWRRRSVLEYRHQQKPKKVSLRGCSKRALRSAESDARTAVITE